MADADTNKRGTLCSFTSLANSIVCAERTRLEPAQIVQLCHMLWKPDVGTAFQDHLTQTNHSCYKRESIDVTRGQLDNIRLVSLSSFSDWANTVSLNAIFCNFSSAK